MRRLQDCPWKLARGRARWCDRAIRTGRAVVLSHEKPPIQSLLSARIRPIRRPPGSSTPPVDRPPARVEAPSDETGAQPPVDAALEAIMRANLAAAQEALLDADFSAVVGEISRADLLAAEQARKQAGGFLRAVKQSERNEIERSARLRLGRNLPLRKPPRG